MPGLPQKAQEEKMIIDTTLREGLQLYGTFFSLKDKKNIITSLAMAGIEEIEAGWVGGKDIFEIMEWSGGKIDKSTISIWSPCREKEILNAFELGVKRINIGVPGSKKHMKKRLNLDEKGILNQISNVVKLGTGLGMEISIGIEDIAGADSFFINELMDQINLLGGFRIRFSDTRGLLSPMDVSKLVSTFKNRGKLKLGTHFHNDFGMASANSVTALDSGADYTDASILGIGERSGITPLEEIASRLVIVDKTKNYDLMKIRGLCTEISRLANVSIPRTKAFAGSDIFACESGIHVHAMEIDPSLMEPYSPEITGARRKIGIGFKSGKSAIKNSLKKLGINTELIDVDEFTQKIKSESFRQKSPLTIADLKLIMESQVNN